MCRGESGRFFIMSTANQELQKPNVVENTDSDFEIRVLVVQDGRLVTESSQQLHQKKKGGGCDNAQYDVFEVSKKKPRKEALIVSNENKSCYNSDTLAEEQHFARKERDRMKKAAYRASLTDEQRIKQREIDRQRVAAFRASLSDEERSKQKELDKQRKAASRMKKYLKREGNYNLSGNISS